MIKKTSLFMLGLTISLFVNAQEIVTTSGGTMENNTIQANWIIGEIFTESISNNSTVVTSGINQPLLKIETSVENLKDQINVSIFPNPAVQIINVKYDGLLPISSKIISMKGSVIAIVELKEQITKIDFSNYSCGIYIIEITNKLGQSNAYQIIKQ